MVKQKSSIKKKGPKGKKARAKAKLDKQWGETAIIDDEKPRRLGKSRLKARLNNEDTGKVIRWAASDVRQLEAHPEIPFQGRQSAAPRPRKQISKQQSSPRKGRSPYHDNVSDSDDTESEDEEAPPLRGLLDAIRKSGRIDTAKQARNKITKAKNSDAMVEDGPASDVEMEGYDDSSSSESESEPEDSGREDDDDDEESVVEEFDGDQKQDLYSQHFNQRPLSPEQLQKSSSTAFKIKIDSKTDFHVVTGPILDADSSFNSSMAVDELKRLADSSFEGNRKVLKARWKKISKSLMTERQASIYPFLARYMDMLITTESRKHRKEVEYLNLLHLLNHVLTSRSRIQRHNRQLKVIEGKTNTSEDEGAVETAAVAEETEKDHFRDQGYTRPTILVLLPNRGACHKFVRALIKLTGADEKNPHFERFHAEFGPTNETGDDEDGKTPLDQDKELRRKAVLERKGKDWNEFFGDDVNQDDDFKLGMALIPKVAKSNKQDSSTKIQVKLYTDFYKSDIIVSSPIGLKMLLAPDDDGKEGDADYLSSIEICLVQNADILMMQNWDHANDVLGALNEEPKKNNDTDFSRVRRYMLEGQGAQWRQLIIATDFVDPYLLSSFKRFGKSLVGSVKMHRKTSPEEAALANVLVPMKQVFQRIPVVAFDQQTDSRTQYFVKNILPEIQRHKQKHTMIYIPSYFDFVALRNIFLKREIAFVSVHEYSRHTEVSRGRARFLQGRKPIMLYTGRAHFFHRHAIKGIRHLIFLGLPEHPQFYADQVNLISTATSLDDDGESVAGVSCLALLTRFEGHALERIVGSANASRMIKSDKSTFLFHS